jgi:hypothetical protein
MQGPFLRKYGVETTIDFQLWDTDGASFQTGAAHAAGDTKIMKDEAAEANTANAFTDEGTGYSIVLAAAEMQAARIVLYIADQTSPKIWLDESVVIETYGNASAQHAFDLGTATQSVNVSQISGDTTAADNAELAFDGTGFGFTNCTMPTTTTVTNTVTANTTLIEGVDATNQIGDAVWDEALAGHVAAGSAGKALSDISAAGIADSVWDEQLSGHTAAGSAGEAQAGSRVADYVWDEVMEANAPAIAQTARQWMRLMASAQFGEDAGVGDWSAKSIDGNKTRISGTLSAAGARESVTTLDGS